MRATIYVALGMAAILGLAAFEEVRRPEPNTEPEKQKIVLDDTATLLPPGVREAWFSALDQAIEKQISFYGNWLEVKPDSDLLFNNVRYYHLSGVVARCDADSQEIALESIASTEERGFLIMLVSEDPWSEKSSKAPALGVGASSPAALTLMDDLCRHLVDRIEVDAQRRVGGDG